MRHKKSFNHLGRTASHRRAMMSNMAASLIVHKRITTTLAKAKALRGYVEPLITKSKEDTTHSRRVVFSYLQDKEAVTELFREVSQKVADRPGGYTRIIKLGTRLGDNADMAMMELVDYNENLLGVKESKKTKTTRRRRSKSKSTAETTPASAHRASVKEEVLEESPVTEEAKEEPKVEAKEEPKVEAKEEPKVEVKDEHQEAPEEEKNETENDKNERDERKE